jgi:hypothetical protein
MVTKPGDILLSSLTATTLMTLFSQLVSEAENEKFNEPKLLDDLVNNLHPTVNKEVSKISGWAGHYAIGLVFSALYAAYLEKTHTKPNVQNSIISGIVGGAIGILGWHSMFKSHHNPPGVNLKKFYIQLMLAHIIFGATAAAMLSLLDKHSKPSLRKISETVR